MMSYGAKLRAMRAILCLTQADLAERAGAQRRDVILFESERALPTGPTREALNAALGIRLDSPEVEAAFRVLAGISQPELPLVTDESEEDSPASQMRNNGAQGLLAA